MKYLIYREGILVFLLSLMSPTSSLCQNLFDHHNTQKYVDHLYELRQFNLAIPELERLVYFNPLDTLNQSKLFRAYWADQQYQQGLQSGLALYGSAQKIPAVVLPELTRLLYKSHRPDSAIMLLQSNPLISESNRFGHTATIYALEADWGNARENILSAQNPVFSHIKLLIDQSAALKYKKKGLAALMSAVLPGSGKFYTRNWKDGIFSLIFVGTTAYQSYRGFNNKGVESLQGWFFGGMSLGFYTGNIAGAYQSAYNYNHKLDQELIDKIEKEYFR